jgi:hypothetical protein
MAKIGAPTKYRAEMCDRLPEMFSEGQSVCEVCGELGISKETFYRWVEQYPAFCDAYKRGLALSQQWWEKAGRAGAIGKIPIQPAVWIYNMKNRFRTDWQDRAEIQHSGTVGPLVIKYTDEAE